MQAREIDMDSIDAEAWNTAAPSWRVAFSRLRMMKVRYSLLSRLRFLEIIETSADRAVRIGLCAVIQSAKEVTFYENIQILPQYIDRWVLALTAVLERFGAGEYRYGGTWSLEEPREQLLGQIPGVTINWVRPIIVQGVDFAHWPTWDAYWRQISNNSRRDFARAQKTYPDLKIEIHRGLEALKDCLALTQERSATYRRKGLPFHSWRELASCVAGVLFSPENTFMALAVAGGRIRAIFQGFELADKTYYISGAAGTGANGAGWFLQLSLVKDAYDRRPDGKFVLGYVDYAIHNEAVGGGLLRSRRAIRASDWPTSEVQFSYRPGC